MNLGITIRSGLSKFFLSIAVLVVCTGLLMGAVWYLVLGSLTDDRVELPVTLMTAWLEYFPDSPRLLARLSQAEAEGVERDLAKAEAHIRKAIELMPGEYSYRISLGSILEAGGDGEKAEQAYREALKLAPNYIDTHWRLANNLVRQGKVPESLEHFKYSTGRNLGLLPNAYDLIWNITGGDEGAIAAITSIAAKPLLTEAVFLAKQQKFDSAARIFRQVEKSKRRVEPESVVLVNELIAAQQAPLARDLWTDTLIDDPAKPAPLLWNGSFESDISAEFGQFDWKFRDNGFVRVVVDTQAAKSGQNSLRLTFLGKDTARITDEIGQTLILKPGRKYQIDCSYRTMDLPSPAGPQLAVWDAAGTQIGASEPVPEGNKDWRTISFTFTATTPVAMFRIQRIPKASYDDPSRGVVWFDDFTIREL